MTTVSSDRNHRRLTWQVLVGASAATAILTLLLANFSTAEDRTAPAAGPVTATVPAVTGPSFADVVDHVSPAVVNISVTKVTRATPTAGWQRLPRGDNSPFDEFFGRFFGGPGLPGMPDQPQESKALGSGFIIDNQGYIATNRHVIEGADSVFVTLPSGDKFDATIVGQDQRTDLALLKVDPPKSGLPYVQFGDSDHARVGDWVLAIGNPFGLGGTATAGIISARGRDIQSGPYDDYLQIDAPINSGNSGGPVFNTRGEVIGINTAIFSPNGGNIGIGFAIPANQAKSVIAELKQNGAVRRGWLGVEIQGIDEDLANALGLPDTNGALIASVVADGPAAKAGLEAGDVITEFAGKTVDTTKTLGRVVAEQDSGERATLTVWRDGKPREFSVKLGELNDTEEEVAAAAPATQHSDAGTALGLALQDLSAADREQLGLNPETEGALVVEVEPRSAAAEQGIQPGDVIIGVNQKHTESAREALDELAAARAESGHALVLVRRGDSQHFVALSFA